MVSLLGLSLAKLSLVVVSHSGMVSLEMVYLRNGSTLGQLAAELYSSKEQSIVMGFLPLLSNTFSFRGYPGPQVEA